MPNLTNQVYTFNTNDWLNIDSYDANGNTTGSGGKPYFYDAMNRLTNVNNSIFITYDGDGNRVSKTVGSTTTFYLLDDRNPSGYVQVLEEWTVTASATNLAKVYNYGSDLISQRVPNTSTNYFIYDGHGSTRALTDNAGTVKNVFTYDAYGILIASNTTAQTVYLYSGEQFDPDLGQYYLRARTYNPGTGRFWTMDTYQGFNQVPISLHKYLYGDANPVNMTDPSGRASTTAAQIGVAVHQYIGDDFIKKVTPGGVSGPSVVSILEDIPGFTLPTRLQGVVTALFPDLTDVSTKQVYEIKPDNARSIILGEAQLQAYIDLFNYLDPSGGWHRGTSYIPPLTVPIDALDYAVAVKGAPGMIVYKVFSVQQIVKRKVVQTAIADNADLLDSIGISTLTTILAF